MSKTGAPEEGMGGWGPGDERGGGGGGGEEEGW